MGLVGRYRQHRCPRRAARTAVADAKVDLPTPPLPTKKLIRTSGLDSFLQIGKRGTGYPTPAFRLSRPIIGIARFTDNS